MKQNSLKISANLTQAESRASVIIMIIYAVGIAGITIPLTGDLFQNLIPVVIIMSLAVSLAFHRSWDLKTIAVFFSIVVLAWVVEAAGVSSGTIFGNYSYGPALGIKLFETPLIIGFNWLLLVYGTAMLTEKIHSGAVVKILTASVLMVVYDLVLETVAPFLGMWHFDSGNAPPRNYVAWFMLAVVFHSLIRIAGIRINNRIASLILVVQFIFFIALSVIFQLSK